ncbi:MAG: hypothetical protein AM326_03350 [Candidatus Thorarchaeota archaeon SMTZ-45]|nr:MAG: hypothetical protein AM326_03350 [Candidatus Thorarchaeota archaeon SMTZ-45]
MGCKGVVVEVVVVWLCIFVCFLVACVSDKKVQKEEVKLGELQEVEELPSWSRFPFPSERDEGEEEEGGK